MKKSLVVTGIIMILAAAWTAASWYTGKLIEQRMTDLVAAANTHIKAYFPDTSITLTAQDYQRGIFSSSVRYLIGTETHDSAQVLPVPGDEITVIEVIDHGPFPLTQLKKFTIIPHMATVHLVLDNTPMVKKWFDITGGQSPIRADARISYNGNTSFDITLIPMDYQTDTLNIQFSGAVFQVQRSNDVPNLILTAHSDSVALTAKNHENKTETLMIKGIVLNSARKPGKFNVDLGDDQLDINQLIMNVDGNDTATLNGFHLKMNLDETDQYLNGQLNYALDALQLRGNDFGSGKLAINVDKLDGQATQQLISAFHQHIMQFVQQNENPDALLAQLDELLISKFPAFLNTNPTVKIAPLSWKNSQGESTLTLGITFTDEGKTDFAPSQQSHPGFQMVKNLDMTLNIPMAMARELVAQTARLRGHDEEESQKLAAQQVQGLSALGQLFKLTVNKDDTITSSVQYADNQAELNGQKIPLQEFFDLFNVPVL